MNKHDMQAEGPEFQERRRFIGQALTVGGAGVLVLLASGEEHDAASRSANRHAGKFRGTQGYRLTDHIRTYYATLE
jgi:hypothetical protein